MIATEQLTMAFEPDYYPDRDGDGFGDSSVNPISKQNPNQAVDCYDLILNDSIPQLGWKRPDGFSEWTSCGLTGGSYEQVDGRFWATGS